MQEYKPARFRRILAWILDWGVCTLLPLGVLRILELLGITPTYVIFPIVIGCFAAVLCRDWLLGGRSIGKRIMGLTVVDQQTGAGVTDARLVLRNILLFFYPVDGGFLLFSGRSLGDRIASCLVIRSRQRRPLRLKPFVIVTAIILAISVPFCGLMYALMGIAQKSESYQLAHDYLAQSETLADQGADAEDITMTGFSQRTELKPEGSQTIHTYTFRADGKTYTVTCHPDGDGWAVCDECTGFH